jgi:hypothetical protein
VVAPGYPLVKRVPCEPYAATNAIETSLAASPGEVRHAAGSGRYTYAWKTEASWVGTCQEVTLGLRDGSEHVARFRFPVPPRARPH